MLYSLGSTSYKNRFLLLRLKISLFPPITEFGLRGYGSNLTPFFTKLFRRHKIQSLRSKHDLEQIWHNLWPERTYHEEHISRIFELKDEIQYGVPGNSYLADTYFKKTIFVAIPLIVYDLKEIGWKHSGFLKNWVKGLLHVTVHTKYAMQHLTV